MSEDLGSIYIEIELEVKRLLDGVDEVNRKLNELPEAANNAASSFDDTEQSADTLNTGLDKLAATIKAVIAASALKEMAEMVQKYQEYAERVRMATSSQDEFNEVQERLLKTANGTFRALSEAQELYITTAASLRSMGYTTSHAIDVQDSMSYAFVKNATSADKATSAISAFSKAINTGKVGADQWETITSAIPSVIDDIASASGKSSAQVRALGAAGKITARDLTEGLKQSLEANETAATGMSNTLVDATVRMNTAITSLLVGIEDGTGVLQAFTAGMIDAADSILAFSKNSEGMDSTIDAGTKALGAMAVVFGARMAGSMAAAGKEKLRYIATTTNQLKAELATAEAAKASAAQAQRHAIAEVRNAQLDRGRLQNTINNNVAARQSISMSNALEAALQRERAAKLGLVQANGALAASAAAANTASRSASAGIRLASGALAMIGGPVGFAMIAGAAVYYFWQQSKQAREEALAFADSLDKLKESMVSMNNTQLRGTIADTTTALEGQEDQASILRKEIASLTAEQNDYTERGKKYNTTAEQGNGLLQKAATIANDLAKKKRDLADVEQKINDTTKTQNEARRLLTNNMLQAMGVTEQLTAKTTTLETAQSAVASAFGKTADEINRANQASQNFNPQSLQITPATADGDKMILSLEEQNELLKIKDERTRAVTKAEMEMAKVSQNGNQKTNAGRLAGENFDLQKSEEERRKAQQDSENQDKKSAASAEAVAQRLAQQQAQLDRLNTGYAEGSLELAKYDAVQALGEGATAQQIADTKAKAAAIYEQTQAVKNLAQAEQAARFIAQEMAARDTTINPATGTAADPTAQITQQEQQKLLALESYQELGVLSTQQYEDGKTAIMQQAAYEREEILKQESERHQNNMSTLMGASSDLAGSLAGAIGNAAGESSAAYKAMFAVSKGFAIAQAGLNLQTAISNAMAIPWPANIPAIAQAMAAGSQIVSTISGLNYGGGRKNGGGVQAGSMYEFGEGNLPEVLSMGGKNYMLPGNNGRVFSNKDVTGAPTIPKAPTGMERLHKANSSSDSNNSAPSGGLNVVINVTNNTAAQTQFTPSYDEQSNTLTIQGFIADMQEKGPMHRSITQNTSATTRLGG